MESGKQKQGDKDYFRKFNKYSKYDYLHMLVFKIKIYFF